MADSVSAQERDLAVPLTWLCHPTLDSGSTRSGGRGAAQGKRRAAPCAVASVAPFQAELEQC